MHVVIVGGGFAGLEAAKELGNTSVRVTLVDRHNYHLFQPLLYQVATAGLASEDVAAPIRKILGRYTNVEVRLGTVDDIDLDAQEVKLADGDILTYDRLILAAGTRTSYFGNDDWARHAPGLKSIPDALEIRRRVLTAFERAEWATIEADRVRNMTFVVVGGGPTGVELAGAISEIACKTIRKDFRHIDTCNVRVVLVEMMDHVLPPYPDELRVEARRMLENLNVEVRTGSKVEAVDEQGITVSGERIETATVLWGAGVQAVPLTQRLGVPIDKGGRIIVDADLSMPGHPDAFAVGDLCRYEHGYDAPLPGLAQVAMQSGRHAAANVIADVRGKKRTPLRYRDLGTMATIGRQKAVADFYGIRTAGGFAWLMWVFVHLFWLVGFNNRAIVFTKWSWSWLTWQRTSRVIWYDDEDLARIAEARAHFRGHYAGAGG